MMKNDSRQWHQRVRSACKRPQTVLEKINQFQNEKTNGTNQKIIDLRQKLYPNLFDTMNPNLKNITIKQFNFDGDAEQGHTNSQISIQSMDSLKPDKGKIKPDNQKLAIDI